MKEILRLVLVLSAICLAAAAALAQVYALTKGPIAHQKRMELLRAIQEVLPDYDNEPDAEKIVVGARVFYPARKGGELVGAAIPVSSEKGYGGRIEALVGVDAEGAVTGVRILSHAETPGLGSRITDPAYLAKLTYKDAARTVRRTLDNTVWKVKKDGGEVDQITGATISPRAVVEAIHGGLKAFAHDRERIVAGQGAAAGAGEAQAKGN